MNSLTATPEGAVLKVTRVKSDKEHIADLQAQNAQLLLTAATSTMTITALQMQNAQLMLALAQLQMGGA